MTREEAIKEIKTWDFLDNDEKEILEALIPELKESEDEKIRKAIIDLVIENIGQGIMNHNNVDCNDMIAWLEKQGAQKEYTFKSLPRLLEMVEPTERAKAYCLKLIDTLVKEGYVTDAKIVGECLKIMNGEKVALATMDENQAPKPKWTNEDEEELEIAIETLHEAGQHFFDEGMDIPFGAFDSELHYFEINIPEGFQATIEGRKIILKRKE